MSGVLDLVDQCDGVVLDADLVTGRGIRGPVAAAAALDDLGIPRWAEPARNEADRVGLRASASTLTKTERRVAELVASGRSNQEVAAELFVSTKTVEANLTRVYRKLSVRSRTASERPHQIRSRSAPESAQWFALSRQVELRRLADEGKTGLLPPRLTHSDIGI